MAEERVRDKGWTAAEEHTKLMHTGRQVEQNELFAATTALAATYYPQRTTHGANETIERASVGGVEDTAANTSWQDVR